VRPVDFVLANAAVLLGANLQASTGLGAGLIIVPLLALVSLDFVPGRLVLASVALSGIMAIHRAHDRPRQFAPRRADHLHARRGDADPAQLLTQVVERNRMLPPEVRASIG
jgi:hypothetical protein